MLRYQVEKHGKRVEHGATVGLVRDFPKEKDAWREVDRLGLLVRINDEPGDVRIHFSALAEHYLKADFGEHAVRPKSDNTIAITHHIVRDYLASRWGGVMSRIYKVGMLHGRITRNPVMHVETRAKTTGPSSSPLPRRSPS